MNKSEQEKKTDKNVGILCSPRSAVGGEAQLRAARRLRKDGENKLLFQFYNYYNVHVRRVVLCAAEDARDVSTVRLFLRDSNSLLVNRAQEWLARHEHEHALATGTNWSMYADDFMCELLTREDRKSDWTNIAHELLLRKRNTGLQQFTNHADYLVRQYAIGQAREYGQRAQDEQDRRAKEQQECVGVGMYAHHTEAQLHEAVHAASPEMVARAASELLERFPTERAVDLIASHGCEEVRHLLQSTSVSRPSSRAELEDCMCNSARGPKHKKAMAIELLERFNDEHTIAVLLGHNLAAVRGVLLDHAIEQGLDDVVKQFHHDRCADLGMRACAYVPAPMGSTSNVEHPSHYNQSEYECIDVIHAWGMGFDEGNAIKYICRAKHKAGGAAEIEDLRKAVFYLQDKIKRLRSE